VRAVAVLVALSLSAFLYVTTETLPIGLLLLISTDLDVTPSAVGLLVTGYGLVVVLASLPLTHLTRDVPRRFLFPGLLAVFIVFTMVSVATSNYWVLLAARMVIALSQALFWPVVVSTAAGLFPARVRGRVLAVVFAGSSLASVVGLPVGTWLGEQAGWRTAFLVLSGCAVLALATILTLLPTSRPGQSSAARGTAPDARRYWLLFTMTVLAITGAFTAFTYVTPFLTDVSGFAVAAIGPLLLVRGIAGVVGVGVGGAHFDRSPWGAMVTPVALQTCALLALYVLGHDQVAAAVLVAATGLAFSALATVVGSRVLQIAPGSVDLASAGTSVAFNIGITLGALLGGVLLPEFGARSTALVSGLLSLAALAVALAEPWVARPVSPPRGCAAPDGREPAAPGPV
jgi:MFS transporter, DHA1 family, inner membrane transport protein